MATIPTRATGYKVLAADWNAIADEVNELNALKAGGTALDSYGASAELLPATRHGCHVHRTTNQTAVVTATWTQVFFNVEREDTDAYHDTVTNNPRITIPSATLAGLYKISASVFLTAVALNSWSLRVRLNGSTIIRSTGVNTTNSQNLPVDISFEYVLANGDYIELQVQHNAGSDRDIDGTSAFTPEFSAYLIGK